MSDFAGFELESTHASGLSRTEISADGRRATSQIVRASQPADRREFDCEVLESLRSVHSNGRSTALSATAGLAFSSHSQFGAHA